MKHVKVFGRKNPEIGGAVIPAHFILHDAQGGCMVVEYEKGELHLYDNPLGIMTNAPNFPWMLTNLRNYVGMKSSMAEAQDFSGLNIKPTGHGSGMFGLPGDITPPSRFVRMAVMTKFADKPRDARSTRASCGLSVSSKTRRSSGTSSCSIRTAADPHSSPNRIAAPDFR